MSTGGSIHGITEKKKNVIANEQNTKCQEYEIQ